MRPLPPWPLRYLIGGNDRYPEGNAEIVEYSYDAQAGETGYCTLTSEKERFDSLEDANRNGRFAPYLPPSDITASYGEWCPDPEGDGFWRNVQAQVTLRAGQGFGRIELDNPDYLGLPFAAVLKAHDIAWASGLRTIAKNPLNVHDPRVYITHPSIDLVVMERDFDGRGSDAMDVLRRSVEQPLLAVRFVGYRGGDQDDLDWCEAVADNIWRERYRNMGVTFSPHGEYVGFEDLQLPLP